MEQIELYKEVSSNDAGRNFKFFANLVVASENKDNTQEVINLLGEYGLNYNPESLDIRVFSMDSATLREHLDLYKKEGYLDYFVNDISKLRFSASKIIERIKACEKSGKGFYNEEGLCSFLFNTNEWNAVLNGLDTTVTVATIESVFGADAEKIQNAITVEGELDINGFDRYWNLTQLMGRCMEAKYGMSEIGEAELVIRNLISNTDLGDSDILLVAFISSQCIKVEELDDIKATINEIVSLELKKGNGVAL